MSPHLLHVTFYPQTDLIHIHSSWTQMTFKYIYEQTGAISLKLTAFVNRVSDRHLILGMFTIQLSTSHPSPKFKCTPWHPCYLWHLPSSHYPMFNSNPSILPFTSILQLYSSSILIQVTIISLLDQCHRPSSLVPLPLICSLHYGQNNILKNGNFKIILFCWAFSHLLKMH